jgi:hypothetical protein
MRSRSVKQLSKTMSQNLMKKWGGGVCSSVVEHLPGKCSIHSTAKKKKNKYILSGPEKTSS